MLIDQTILGEAKLLLRQSAVDDHSVKLSQILAVLMELEQGAIADSRDDSAAAYSAAQDAIVAAVTGRSIYRY